MRTMSIYIPSNTTIIPVNTLTLSKTLTLPAVSTSPGRVIIIKDTYGTASSQYIQLSTTGIDTVERGSTQSIRLSTSYGSWMFTNDGVTTWFLVDAYKNSLSQQLVATLPPFATPSITVSFVPNTLSSSWTPSINAVSYTVRYYYNQVASTTNATLIQTFTGLTATSHSFTATPNVNYYYYVTVTSINANSSSITTSPLIYAIVTPSPPTNVVVLFNSNVLACGWTLSANTTTYTVVLYETLTPATTDGSVFQTITGITLPYYNSALNVNQGRYYYATVQSFNLSGSSSVITSSNNVLGAAIPLAPPSASITILGSSVVASWEAAVNAVTYIIKFYSLNTSGTTGGTLVETASDISSLTQTSTITLLINKYYYATITSKNPYGESAVYRTTATSTAQYGYAPPATTSLTISVSGMNVVASWVAALNTDTYTVTFYQVDTAVTSGALSAFETDTGQTGVTTTSSTPLVNDKYYYATIIGYNAYGHSSTVTSTTASAQIANPPQPPTGISVVYSGGSLSTSWSASLNAATYTVVFYYVVGSNTTGGFLEETDPSIAGLTKTIVAEPRAGYYYYTTVTAYNTYGYSATITSGNASQITVAPSAVTNVSISLVGYNIVCTWTNSANTTSYTVSIYKNTTASVSGGVLAAPAYQLLSGPPASVTALNGFYYYASVQSVNGYSFATSYSSATSQVQIPPSDPSNVSVSLTGIQVTASWTASTYYTTSYIVTFTQTDFTTSTTFQIVTGVTGTSQTTSIPLVNGQYYFASVRAANTIPLYSNNDVQSSNYVLALLYVQNLSISVSNSTGVASLSWTAFSGATSYSYVVYKATGNNYTSGSVLLSTTTASTSVTVNTYAAAYYYFTIIAVTPLGSSVLTISSIVQSTYAGSTTTAVTTPYVITATNVATMSWTAYSGATGYVWTLFKTSNTNFTGYILGTGTTNSSTLTASYTGLTLDYYYYFSVYATTSTTPSSYGTSPLSLYNNGVPTGGSVTLSAFSALTGGSFVLTSPSMNTTGYIFYLSTTTNIANSIYSSGIYFNYLTNAIQQYTVPAGITSIVVSVSGAGGSGGTSAGAGALVTGSLTVTPGSTLSIYVGSTGTTPVGPPYFITAYGGWPGGGTALGGEEGGGGGGYSAIADSVGTTYYVIAGAGGGGTGYGGSAGSGGLNGTSGVSVNGNDPATGGTQTAGGTGTGGGTDGGYLQGGNAASTTYDGGGGGGGYYGGGGGPGGGAGALLGGGGGGSSLTTGPGFTLTSVTTAGGAAHDTNGQVILTLPVQYKNGQSVSFTTTLAAGTTYYAILVPNNSFGNGTAFYSAGVATLAVPVGGSITLAAGLTTTSGSVTITAASPATTYTVYISTTTSSAQSVYSFSTTTTGSAVAFTPSPSLTASTTYYAVLLPKNSYVNGTYSYSTGVATPAALAALYTFTNVTFNTGGTTGASGPILSAAQSGLTGTPAPSTWYSSYFTMTTQGYQLWTVPQTGTYTITCAGAGTANGYGIIIQTAVYLTRSQQIQIVVGQPGIRYNTNSSGGCGGSFVASGTTPATGVVLVAAGGGGGTENTSSSGGVANATTSTTGNSGFGDSSAFGGAGAGGSSGGGGSGSTTGYGGGGGGFYTNGISANEAVAFGYGGGGYAFVNGCLGGTTATSAVGGFGGGGGTHGNSGGGAGGGGYSGGGGSGQSNGTLLGGGGGSYPAGATNMGTNSGNGYVTIATANAIAPPVGGSITLAADLTTTSGSVTITAATSAISYTVYISTTTSSTQSVYSFTTTTTGSAIAFSQSPTLTANTTYYAVLLPTNAGGNGTYSNSTGIVAAAASVLYTFTGTLTFTPAGAVQRFGPTLLQCTTAYSAFGPWIRNTAYFNMTTQGYQLWTVPSTRTYTVVCAGAATFNPSNGCGYGAIITTTISLTKGQIIQILVGQMGGQYSPYSSGGGGGSFVASGITPATGVCLIAAGGGGGFYTTSSTGAFGQNASLTTSGNSSGDGQLGGTAGNGGSAVDYAQGGSGFIGNGVTPSIFSSHGGGSFSFQNGGTGGSSPFNGFGGFGGGGGIWAQQGGGGGGGYSGGGGSGGSGGQSIPSNTYGGGGGSYCSTTITSSSVTNTGQGYVSIT